MVRSDLCARPGCGDPASALLTYDYGSRTAWIDDPGAIEGSVWPLCAHHADQLKVPVGWERDDRRVAVVSLRSPLAS